GQHIQFSSDSARIMRRICEQQHHPEKKRRSIQRRAALKGIAALFVSAGGIVDFVTRPSLPPAFTAIVERENGSTWKGNVIFDNIMDGALLVGGVVGAAMQVNPIRNPDAEHDRQMEKEAKRKI